MATITLRPTSASGNNWSNIGNAYDGNESTCASVSVSRFNYSSRELTLNFNTSVIPSGATINSATLTMRSNAGKTTITAYVDINGDSQHRVINKQQSSTITNYTANVASYIFNLQNIVVTAHNSNYSGNTFDLHELWIDVDYTEPITTYTVRFLDWDNSVISTQTVTRGGSATPPPNPTRDGYTFTGWSGNYTNVTANVDIIAQYTKNSSSGGEVIESNTLLVDWDTYELHAGRFWEGELEGSSLCYDASKTDNGLRVYLGNVNIQGVVVIGIKGDGPGIYTLECDCIIPSNKTYTPNFFANVNTFSSDGAFIEQANNNIIMNTDGSRYYMEFEITSDFDYLWFDVGVYNGVEDDNGGYYEFANLNFYKGNFDNRGKFIIGSGGGSEDTSVRNIKLGASTIDKLYLGTSQILKAYLGSILIYSYSSGGIGGGDTPVIGENYQLYTGYPLIVENSSLDTNYGSYITEIVGNTTQDSTYLTDIRSVGVLQGDGTYKVDIIASNQNGSQTQTKSIYLPQPLRMVRQYSDRLYWNDTLGKYCIEQNVAIFKMSEYPNSISYQSDTAELLVGYVGKYSNIQTTDCGFCNILPSYRIDWNFPNEGIYYEGGGVMYIVVSKDKASNMTELKQWCINNNFTCHVRYDTPVIVETDITDKILFNTYANYTKVITDEKQTAPTSMSGNFAIGGGAVSSNLWDGVSYLPGRVDDNPTWGEYTGSIQITGH